MLRNIPYITLWVRDFERTVSFYRDNLGLPVIELNENFARFGTDGTQLAFHALASGQAAPNRGLEIHFDVADVDPVYESLRGRGVTFNEPPANMPWGVRMAAFDDPEGWTVEIVGPVRIHAV
ncbi:MAG: VOC family protein [Chloroflexia bacterium]